MDDFDIEMGDAVDVPMEEPELADILIADDQQEDGEVEEPVNDEPVDADARKVVPNKVHMRGLDALDEHQLKSYLAARIGAKGADRIEWIDDTSANLVFNSDSAAQEALILLAGVEIADATQLPPSEVLPAKPFAEKPEVALQVRFAVESDRKERGAAQRSRFYLFHPEWDPETEEGRRRREGGRERRYRDRDDRGKYRRNGRSRYDDRYEEEPEQFDVNLYDDDAGSRAQPTPRGRQGRDSRSPSDRSKPDRHRSVNRDKELFPNRQPRDPLRSERGAYVRNRSASPAGGGRDAMMDDLAKDREVVRNREKARSLKDRISRSNTRSNTNTTSKELFPGKVSGDSGRRSQMDQVPPDVLEDRVTDPSNGISIRGLARQTGSHQGQGIAIKGTSSRTVKELFPDKFGGNSNSGKELFADKLEGRGRRRQRAEDLFY